MPEEGEVDTEDRVCIYVRRDKEREIHREEIRGRERGGAHTRANGEEHIHARTRPTHAHVHTRTQTHFALTSTHDVYVL